MNYPHSDINNEQYLQGPQLSGKPRVKAELLSASPGPTPPAINMISHSRAKYPLGAFVLGIRHSLVFDNMN